MTAPSPLADPGHRRRRPRGHRAPSSAWWSRGRKPAPLPNTHTDVLVRPPARRSEPGRRRAGRAAARRRPRSRSRSRPPPGWSGCASGWPARRAGSAAGCSACSAGTGSTRTPGRRSRTSCSPPTSASPRPSSWSRGCAPGCGSRAAPRPTRGPRCARSWSSSSTRRMDRRLQVSGADGNPGVVLVVGVNGSGKTTTVGKIARILVAEDQHRHARRGRHLPRRRGRPAGHLGRAGGRRGGPRGPRAPTPRASPSRRSSTASTPASTR